MGRSSGSFSIEAAEQSVEDLLAGNLSLGCRVVSLALLLGLKGQMGEVLCRHRHNTSVVTKRSRRSRRSSRGWKRMISLVLPSTPVCASTRPLPWSSGQQMHRLATTVACTAQCFAVDSNGPARAA